MKPGDAIPAHVSMTIDRKQIESIIRQHFESIGVETPHIDLRLRDAAMDPDEIRCDLVITRPGSWR